MCDDVQDCPQTETSDGGEDEDDCVEGEQIEFKESLIHRKLDLNAKKV